MVWHVAAASPIAFDEEDEEGPGNNRRREAPWSAARG